MKSLCPDCIHFLRVPFTAGHCRRRLIGEQQAVYPRITAERDWPDNDIRRCGPDARYFVAKKDVADAKIEAWRTQQANERTMGKIV